MIKKLIILFKNIKNSNQINLRILNIRVMSSLASDSILFTWVLQMHDLNPLKIIHSYYLQEVVLLLA